MPHPQERIARCAGQSASPAPLDISRRPVGQADIRRNAGFFWIDILTLALSYGNTRKGQEPLLAPALPNVSEFVEHSAMDGMNDPDRKMRGQRVVVAFVDRAISEFVILDNMLVEEAVQGPLLSCFQSLEIIARRQCAFREIGHDNPPEICRETTGGWPMGPGRPGHRIA